MRHARRVKEPLTVTLDTVVQTLLDHGCERQAGLVRSLKESRRTLATVEAEWRQMYEAVVARLRVYEPPAAPTQDRNGKPGPMSDG